MSINNKATEAKYNVNIPITAGNGVKGNIDGVSCFVETKMRIEVVGVGPTCTIDIEGKVRGSPNWYVITTSTGAITGTIDISTYDFIRYNVTNQDGTGFLYASGFVLNTSTGSGSSGDASAANQVIGNNLLNSLNNESLPKTINIDESVSNIVYFGYADAGSLSSNPSWRVKKIEISGLVSITTYADGNTNFDNIWDNRLTLSYS